MRVHTRKPAPILAKVCTLDARLTLTKRSQSVHNLHLGFPLVKKLLTRQDRARKVHSCAAVRGALTEGTQNEQVRTS
jgi:hypothetical protein